MGDENQIRKLVSDASKESLTKSLELVQRETRPYHLDQEFAQTRKNRSFFVVGVTLATVIIFAVAAIVTARFIEQASERQEVDISSFEALNLKDLLNVAKRTEDEYNALQRELSVLERELEVEVRSFHTAYAAELELIAASRADDAEKNRLRDRAARDRDTGIRRVEARFTPTLEAKRVEVMSAANRMEQYDSRMLEQARQNAETLAAERQVFEIERQRLSEQYENRIATLEESAATERAAFEKNKQELLAALQKARSSEMTEANLRYNPLFEDPAVLIILQDTPGRPELPDVMAPESFAKAGIDASLLEMQARATAASLRLVADALDDIPSFNSVPPALAAMEAAAYRLAFVYRDMADAAAQALQASQAREAALEAELRATRTARAAVQAELDAVKLERTAYLTAIGALAMAGGEAGYVLTVTGSRIQVWLRSFHASKSPTEAWIVRDDKNIATLTLKPDGPIYTATIVGTPGSEHPRPFDTVVVRIDDPTAAGGNR
jgi:hypothetical protein